MDVYLGKFRFLFGIIAVSLLVSCGNDDRFDLSTDRGRRARIDEANFHLSRQECLSALEAIGPLYNSSYVDDEIRVVMASGYACMAGFNALTMIANISGATNYFKILAKSMSNVAGDGNRGNIYSAIDVLTENNNKLSASSRGKSVNTYMVFVQLATIGIILRNYGNADADGTQGTALVYNTTTGTQAGEMSDVDACALTAAFSHFSDSFSNSSLSDADTKALSTSLNTICTTAGLTSCSAINKNRSNCDGSNAYTITASAVVGAIDSGW